MNIKKIAPIVFIIFLVLAWYAGVSGIVSTPLEYKEHLKRAKQYEKEERYKYALEEYQSAISMKPENKDLYMSLAEVYERLDDFDSAVTQCNYVIANFADNEDAYLEVIQYFIQKEDIGAAAEKIKAAYMEHPDNKKIKKYYSEYKGKYQNLYKSYAYITSFHDNQAGTMITVTDTNNDGNIIDTRQLYGVIDIYGEVRISNSYEGAGLFSNMPDASEQLAPLYRDGEWVYVDENGYKALVNEKKYDYLGQISEGIMVVGKKDKYGYAIWKQPERSFEAVTKLDWDYAGTMYNGVAAVCKDGKWALINSEWKEITKYKYDEIVVDEHGVCSRNNVVFVKNGEKYQLIDLEGKEITKGEYDDVKPFYTGELAAVCKNGKWGFINTEGKLKIKCKYDEADSFSKNYAPVMKDGKWGYIDKENKLIIDYQFDGAKPFSDTGIAPVQYEDMWSLIQVYIYE